MAKWKRKNAKTYCRSNRIRKNNDHQATPGVEDARELFGWFMSASERIDPELNELLKYRLVQCHHVSATGGLPSWGVTEFGKRISERQAKGVY